jgi:hypothetical protein
MMVPMAVKLTERDREVFARKEAVRERDRQLVAAGTASFDGMNRTNAMASSVIHLYRPAKKLGLPR